MSDPKPTKPVSPFLANILKNAAKAPRHEKAGAGLETRSCQKCGAGRAEGSELSTCEYCGASFHEE